MFDHLICRRDLLNDTLTRRFRIALPWLVLCLSLLLQALIPAVAISQTPPGPSALTITGGTTVSPPPTKTGKIYYVATTGVDAPSTVGSSSNPFRTIRYTYDKKIVAGDTIIVKSGTYTDYYVNYGGLLLNKNGTSTAPITIKAENKWGAILDGGNTVAAYMDPAHKFGFYLTGNYHVIEGFEIRNMAKGGIHVWSNNNRIIGNRIHHVGNAGDRASSYGQDGIYSATYTSGNSYLSNYIHDNGRAQWKTNLDHGLYLCGDNELVANNIVVSNAAYGLHVAGYNTVSNMKIYNNVFAYNGASGIILWQALKGIDIRNNIFYKNTQYAINSYNAHGTGVFIDRNIIHSNPYTMNFTQGGSDYSYTLGTNYTQDPKFLSDPTDYRLTSTSPAIGKGLILAEVPDNFDGVPRPQDTNYNIGAY